MIGLRALLGALGTMLGVVSSALAQGNLTVYCSVERDWCEAAAAEFQRTTGVKVSITNKATNEFYAQIRAESANPRGDVWWGGTGDPYLQAAEEGLLLAYQSPMVKDLHPWAVRQGERSNHQVIGVYTSAIGFGYNTDLMTRRKLAPPKCWADLLRPEFKGDVESSHPASSGTAYTILATLVQLMGEEQAFDYMKRLHRNINQYTKSGQAQARSVARGESLIGVSFLFGFAVEQVVSKAPITLVSPCEGTGFEIGSMAIIKGARNPDNAKKWYDWALGPLAQGMGFKLRSFQLPANRNVAIPPGVPRMEDVKLIDYDFRKYGSSAERKRLIDRWEKEVNALPR